MYDDTKREQETSDFVDDLYSLDDEYLGYCASSHDCTGLIPAGQVTQAQLLSYKDVYSFPPAVMVAEKEEYHLSD